MFVIIGTYHGKSEEIDSVETKSYAEYLLREYSMAYGKDWALRIVEKKKGGKK